MRATDTVMRPFVAATSGGISWLSDGIPQLRSVEPGNNNAGSGWFGIQQRGAYRVTSVASEELLPPWLALILVIGTLIFAWRRESV